MARREDIDTSIWSDPDFLALTPEAKLTYLWSFTNQRCGMAGLYKAVPQAIEMETGLTSKKLETALRELSEARFAFFDGRVLWVRSRIKLLRSKSPNIAKAILRDVESVGTHPYAHDLLVAYQNTDWLTTVLEPLLKTLPKGSNPSKGHEGFQGTGKGIGMLEVPASTTPETPKQPAARFNGKPVSEPLLICVTEILDAFNKRANTSYRPLDDRGQPTEELKRILGAVTKDGRITSTVAIRMIDVAFSDPNPYWAPKRPHPGNVFGGGVAGPYLQEALSRGERPDKAIIRKLLGEQEAA